ncbi:hypothetical protein FDECE_14522 [Fusarium decemcellulare]|nr:hypothetical protein FDECE_14522 [Fusarium decemcellulare]
MIFILSTTIGKIKSTYLDEMNDPQSPNAGKGTARPYRSKKQRPGKSCTFELAAPIKKGRISKSRRTGVPQPEAPTPDSPAWEPFQGTVTPNRTALYVGNSSDQDVYLLRHLPFDETNSFGRTNWRVWKIFADERAPAYFTASIVIFPWGSSLTWMQSYPNTLLDAKDDIYDLDQVNAMVNPYQPHLLGLYYKYVHPSLPILVPREHIEASIAAGTIPASLVASIYSSAIPFWHRSSELTDVTPIARSPLCDLIFRAVNLEARTPSLQTIQAMLLYMQLLPVYIREPNHPGFWALTCQLVGLAQEVGLHIDPANWNIRSSERHLRRILWWAVYMHDKWLAHWLGRPSHIDDRQFSVQPLTVDDFQEVAAQPMDVHLSNSTTAFVMLTRLTTVLSSVMDNFYTINQSSCVMSPEEALSRASQCQVQLRDCLAQQGSVLLRPSRGINDYAFVFAYYGIAVSIQRALFACVGGTSYYDIDRETILFQNLFDVFEDLLKQNDLNGLWLSYCKSNMAIIGSFIITALLSSTDENVYETRQAILDGFRGLLQQLADRFEFAPLPLLRLNLLLERFTDSNGGAEDS